MKRQSWIATCALALGFVFLLGLAVPAEATCWLEYNCKVCRSWGGGGGGGPIPEPLPALQSFLQSMNAPAAVAPGQALPAPWPQPCCTCCSPPGGPVNCDYILQPAAMTPEVEAAPGAEVEAETAVKEAQTEA